MRITYLRTVPQQNPRIRGANSQDAGSVVPVIVTLKDALIIIKYKVATEF